jgi:hypothetical protein
MSNENTIATELTAEYQTSWKNSIGNEINVTMNCDNLTTAQILTAARGEHQRRLAAKMRKIVKHGGALEDFEESVIDVAELYEKSPRVPMSTTQLVDKLAESGLTRAELLAMLEEKLSA